MLGIGRTSVVANREYVEKKGSYSRAAGKGRMKKRNRGMDETTTEESESDKNREERTGEKEIRMMGRSRARQKRD